MKRFQIIVPIVTPYGEDGAVNADALAAHASILAEAGVDGFFVCGTTGEGPLLADDEVVVATRAVAKAAPGCRIIPQVGRPSTRASLTLLERCIEVGATAVAVVTPYFFEVTDKGVRDHYLELVSGAGGIPVLAYVIPARTGNDVGPAVMADLASCGLAGLKDTTRSSERHREYLAVRHVANKPDFEIHMGEPSLALEALRMGSSGVVPSPANFRPELFVEMTVAATEGDYERAETLQAQITETVAAPRGRDIAIIKRNVVAMLRERKIAYPDNGVRAPLR